MDAEGDTIIVGVCTYRRPTMLLALLRAIAALKPVSGCAVEILVVDNDPDGSAAGAIENARSWMPFPIHIAAEPARGIANARNRVLDEAVRLRADYLALIDDDERMPPDWLTDLLAVLQASDADAVGAPAYWDLPDQAPAWQHALPTSPNYEALRSRRRSREKPRLYPSTNNVLMRARIYRDLGIRFDTRFGMTGGEDTDFFRRAKEAGARYTFTSKAAVLETVPASRLTLRWRFWRWAGVARGNVRMHRLQYGDLSAWRHYLPRSLPNLVTGPALMLAGVVAGPDAMLRGLKHLGGAVGVMQELMGHAAGEYTTVHGS